MEKIGIIGVLNNPATSLNSHSSGMVNIVKELFNASILTEKDDWESFDKIIVYHGVNFRPNSYNIIGGINDEILERAKKLSLFRKNKYSLDGFQLNGFSIKRKLGLYDNYEDIPLIELPKKNKLVIGDSHSISVWPNNEYEISRNDGKTLYGFLKLNKQLKDYEHIIFYFGNIDLRFHLARQENPILATKELFNRYCEYASQYNCTITQLLPIEDESRKIPQSGHYLGKSFFGSIELRKELRNIANEIIIKSGLNYISWPDTFLDEKGNLSFEIMEPKQSVHIKPRYYLKNIKEQLKLF